MDTSKTLIAQIPFDTEPGVVKLATHVVAELVGRINEQSASVRYAHAQGAFNRATIEEVHATLGTTLSLEGLAKEINHHARTAEEKARVAE